MNDYKNHARRKRQVVRARVVAVFVVMAVACAIGVAIGRWFWLETGDESMATGAFLLGFALVLGMGGLGLTIGDVDL